VNLATGVVSIFAVGGGCHKRSFIFRHGMPKGGKVWGGA